MDNFDDIIFEHKNKSYGAYVMRKRYDKNLSIALLLTLLLFFVINLYIVFTIINVDEYTDMQLREEIAEYEQFAMLKNIDTLMMRLEPPKKKIQKNTNLEPIVVDSIKKQTDTLRLIKLPEKKIDSLKIDSLTKSSDSIQNGSADGSETADIFVLATLPVFPGGNEYIAQFIRENTVYPAAAYAANIRGTVRIEYTVNVLGYVTDVKVSKSVHPLLDNEALRVVKLFPKFTPGKRHGRPVPFKIYAKFSFGY